ncbi:MAG: LacI family transcriptional regulator, partial [Clostridiales bacterium]|nr:LacI family transcriptional regulator [Clostridiales bacterium]
MAITIQDVAKAAGVSVATVSRVLNGGQNVRAETAALVMSKVESLGYRPNLLGRHLRMNETRTILVIAATISNTLTAKVISGIEEAGRETGYSIVVGTTNDDAARENAHLNLLRNRFVDGIIILSTVMSAEEMRSLGKRHHIIQCCEYLPGTGVPHVAIDNRRAARDAVQYLISGGRRRIAYMGVVNHLISSSERYRGYTDALAEAGIPLDRALIADGNYGFRSAIKIMNDFLAKGSSPDALFCISDRMAAGAIRALKDNGVGIPGDLSVVGFDNTDTAYISDPGITTVAQSPREMGDKAMRLMVRRLHGEKR